MWLPIVVTMSFLLLLCGSSQSQGSASEQDKLLDKPGSAISTTFDALPDLISSPSLSLVFFSRKETPKTRYYQQLFEDSSEILQQYEVKLAVLDCMNAAPTETACNKAGIDTSVFAYRNGTSLLSLDLEYLVDVDSIVANALQLLLLPKVPVIESRLERQELEQSLIGHRDLLFFQPRNLDTAEHRVFLEIAYAYQDLFSFAFSIDYKTALGLQDSEELAANPTDGLWVLFCSEAKKDEVSTPHCPHTIYKGEVTLYGLATFLLKLQEKSVFHAPKDGIASLFAMVSDDPIVYAYLEPEQEKEFADVMSLLATDLRGSSKLVFVNMEDPECRSAAQRQGFQGSGPGIGLKTKNEEMHFLHPQDFSVSEVRLFLLHHLFSTWVSKMSSSSGLMSAKDGEKDIDFLIEEVETQDDSVASAVFSLKQKEMSGLELVPGLLKETFYKTIRRSPLLIVLFYEPFDHVSMAFLRDFGRATQILANNFSTTGVLAYVNCYDATDLCSAEKVITYPTTRIYQQNAAGHETYSGSLDALSVARTAKLLQLHSPVQLTTEQEVDKFSKGDYPSDFSKFTPGSVFLLTADSASDLVTVFKDISAPLAQVTALGLVHPSLAAQVAEKYGTTVPSLVAFNREDRIKPVRMLALNQAEDAVSSMTAFIRGATIPFVPELGVENFPHLFARHQPMAILFVNGSDAETNEAAQSTFSTLASSQQFPATIFCWMDARVKSLGLKILSEYTWRAQLPMVSVVKHREGKVFNFQPSSYKRVPKDDPLQSEALTNWLNRVLSGEAFPSKILEHGNWGPPGPYYNFLELQQNNGPGPAQGHQDDVAEEDVYYNQGIDNLEGELPMENGGPPAVSDDSLLNDEEEVRKMLLEFRSQQKLRLEPLPRDSHGRDEEITPQDSHSGQSHSEL